MNQAQQLTVGAGLYVPLIALLSWNVLTTHQTAIKMAKLEERVQMLLILERFETNDNLAINSQTY